MHKLSMNGFGRNNRTSDQWSSPQLVPRGRVAKDPGVLVPAGCWSCTGLRGPADTGSLASPHRPSIRLPSAASRELPAPRVDVPSGPVTGWGMSTHCCWTLCP